MVPEKILETEGFARILRFHEKARKAYLVFLFFFNTAGLAIDSGFSR